MIRAAIFLLVMLITNVVWAESDDVVAQLEQRINELTDKVEQLTHKNDVLLKRLDSLAADIEYRFKESEKSKSIQEPKAAQAIKPGNPKQAKTEFDKAIALLKAQQYDEAERALSVFVKAYPNSEYTGNAYYWLGESFALRKKYDKAAINYILSFNKFPDNSKATLSMFKLASALNMLGKKKEACSTLDKVKLKKNSLTPALQKMLQKETVSIGCK